MSGPGASVRWFLMDEDADAGWGDWCSVEIKGTVDLGVGRELGIESRASEKVESEESLREKLVPEMEREIGVGAAEAGDEVIFESSNGALSGVATMEAWWDELKIDALGLHVGLEEVGSFVV